MAFRESPLDYKSSSKGTFTLNDNLNRVLSVLLKLLLVLSVLLKLLLKILNLLSLCARR